MRDLAAIDFETANNLKTMLFPILDIGLSYFFTKSPF